MMQLSTEEVQPIVEKAAVYLELKNAAESFRRAGADINLSDKDIDALIEIRKAVEALISKKAVKTTSLKIPRWLVQIEYEPEFELLGDKSDIIDALGFSWVAKTTKETEELDDEVRNYFKALGFSSEGNKFWVKANYLEDVKLMDVIKEGIYIFNDNKIIPVEEFIDKLATTKETLNLHLGTIYKYTPRH